MSEGIGEAFRPFEGGEGSLINEGWYTEPALKMLTYGPCGGK